MYASSSWAVTIPSAASPGFGDEVRSADGVSCRNGNSGPQVEFGAATEDNAVSGKDSVAYARITLSLDRPKSVDCSNLYQLELERLNFELKQLKERSRKRTGTITIE